MLSKLIVLNSLTLIVASLCWGASVGGVDGNSELGTDAQESYASVYQICQYASDENGENCPMAKTEPTSVYSMIVNGSDSLMDCRAKCHSTFMTPENQAACKSECSSGN